MVALDEILELKSRIELLAQRDQKFRVFGARSHNGGGHHYRFLPPRSEMEVLAFEKQHGIELPVDYRLYVTNVGDGGVGPDCGLETLADASSGVMAPHLPFPWMEKVTLSRPEVYAFWENPPGFLLLCQHGDRNTTILVVNGPTKGTMWKEIPAVTEEILIPYQQTFCSWYRDWVETKLRFLDKEPLIDSIEEGMTLADLVGVFGPPMRTEVVESAQRKAVCFKDAIADFLLDASDKVIKISRYSL